MTTTDKATKRPWVVTHQTASDYGIDIVSPDNVGKLVATLGECKDTESIPMANARLIVKAVNCHDELVEACKIALKRITDIEAKLGNQDSGRRLDAINHLQQALKRAESEA